MANIKSQIKRIRTSERRRIRNKDVRSALKTHIRRFNEAIAEENLDQASEHLKVATIAHDKAARKGIIHRNQAANRNSRLMKLWNKTAAAPRTKAAPEQDDKLKTKKAGTATTKAKTATAATAKTKATTAKTKTVTKTKAATTAKTKTGTTTKKASPKKKKAEK